MSRRIAAIVVNPLPTHSWSLFWAGCTLAVLVGGHVLTAVGQDGPQLAPQPGAALPALPAAAAPVQADAGEVLTRGPIHEAFAQPAAERVEPAMISKQPPAAIEELPPDAKPEGDAVLWIPGYWAWDDERNDFLWISGVYRDVPPNQTWVGGYWRQQPAGWQWVPGFWTAAKQEAVEFLPAPPADLDNGPVTPQPSDDHFWVAGSWRYVDTRYQWQAGYWSRCQPNWIWMPARYCWTPRGYIYTAGYWDYTLAHRGVCFAPMYYQHTALRPGFVHTPTVCLRPNLLTVHLWSRPRCGHYYFGDYYGVNYIGLGFRPWFQPVVVNRPCYDPLFTYYSWQGCRLDTQWNTWVHQRHDYCLNNLAARPPRTWVEQRNLVQQSGVNGIVNNVQVVNSPNTAITINNIQNTTINNTTLLNQTAFIPTKGRIARAAPFGREAADVTTLQVQNAALAADLHQVARQQREAPPVTLPQTPIGLVNLQPEARNRLADQGNEFRRMIDERRRVETGATPLLTSPPAGGVTGPNLSPNPTVGTSPAELNQLIGAAAAERAKVKLPIRPVRPVELPGLARNNPAVRNSAGETASNGATLPNGQVNNGTGPILKLDPAGAPTATNSSVINPPPAQPPLTIAKPTGESNSQSRGIRPLNPALEARLRDQAGKAGNNNPATPNRTTPKGTASNIPIINPSNTNPPLNNPVVGNAAPNPTAGKGPLGGSLGRTAEPLRINPTQRQETTAPALPTLPQPITGAVPGNSLPGGNAATATPAPSNTLRFNSGRPLSAELQERLRNRGGTTSTPQPSITIPNSGSPLITAPQQATPPSNRSAPPARILPPANLNIPKPQVIQPATPSVQSIPPTSTNTPRTFQRGSGMRTEGVRPSAFNTPSVTLPQTTVPRVSPPQITAPQLPLRGNSTPAVPRITTPPQAPRITTPRINPQQSAPQINIPQSTPRINIPLPSIRSNPNPGGSERGNGAANPARGLNNGGGIRNFQPRK